MLFNFANIALYLGLAAGFVVLMIAVGSLVRPSRPTKDKLMTYECGEVPVGPGRIQFNLRFYLVAFVFIIFDVEIAFMYPITAVYKKMVESGWGVMAFVEIAIFVSILLVGFVYAWSQGGLDWVMPQAGETEKERPA